MAGEEGEGPGRENLRKEAWMACTSLVLTFYWPQLRSHVKLPGLEKASLCVQEEEARPGIGGHQWSVPRDPQLREVKTGTGIPLCRELRAQPVVGCLPISQPPLSFLTAPKSSLKEGTSSSWMGVWDPTGLEMWSVSR